MKEQLLFILHLLTIVCVSGSIFAQKIQNNNSKGAQQTISEKISPTDSIALVQLPVLQPENAMLKTNLPYAINNATQPYFRPFYQQASVECGQYSGIAFNFCYEINYVRNLPANVPENQYPTHYTFNFMNDGFGWHGVSYHHSWEIAKRNGHPNIVDYGANYEYGPKVWISGYEKYYHGMFNKIDEVYQIQAGTPEGLLVLKNWLHNHLDGSDVGGIASFYSGSPWNTTTLPAGTPEGGKHVMVSFDPHVGHACTITGYNDSIRYDYNQDGQYTNDIDINGDGTVDMRDWEIGGLLFMDSYNGGINWADSGFCYMMYKTLAERPENGGIWNHAAHVITVKEDYEPLLTLKATVAHNCRDKIKISAGVSSDPGALYPDKILNFPIFNYQGGCQFMQGGWNPDSLSLELGLDITPLLAYVIPGEEARFFLMIDEDDPENWYSGQLLNFSIIDYTNGLTENPSPSVNIPLVENGLTLASVNATLNFDELLIEDEELPLAITNEPYSHQLTATGGKPPYEWDLVQYYDQTSTSSQLPVINGIALEFDDTIHATTSQVLDFEFPFYGEIYDTVYVHTDGFLMFDEQQYPWPYMYDEELMIRKSRNISPFLNVYLYLGGSGNNTIRYEGDDGHATFYWNMSSSKLESDQVKFATTIYPDGRIEFFYGDEELFIDHNWGAGISAGDDLNYSLAAISNQQKMPENTRLTFNPSPFPAEMSLSNDGILTGMPQKNYNGIPVRVQLTDQNEISLRKTFAFYSWYAGTNDQQNPDFNIKVYPIPLNDRFFIDLVLQEPAVLNIKLISLQGQVIQTIGPRSCSAGNTTIEIIPEQKLPEGIYFLKIDSGIREFTKKTIVVR